MLTKFLGSVELVNANVPEYLKSKNIWHRTKVEWNEDKGKFDKDPIHSLQDYHAKSNASGTWTSFEDAVKGCEEGDYLPAIAIKNDLDWICLDIDNALKPDESPEKLLPLINSFKGYSERSVSGTGIHIFIPGFYSNDVKVIGCGEYKIEIIVDHFITLTGEVISNNLSEDFQKDFKENSRSLTALVTAYLNERDKRSETEKHSDHEYSIEAIEEMLQVIPPDLKRGEGWLKVMFGLQDWALKTGEDVFEIANEWCSGRLSGIPAPKSYQGKDDVKSTLKSFKVNANGITVGSLIYLAKNYGWVPPKPPAIKVDMDAVMADLGQSYLYLEEHGRGHLTQVVNNENGFSTSKVNISNLKNHLYAGYNITLNPNGKKPDKVNIIDYWNQPLMYGHDKGPKVYKRIDFDPRPHPEECIYNLWSGFTVEPVFDEDVSDFLAFIRVNICGNDLKATKYLMSFMAHMIQRPYELPMVSVVLRGSATGTGKSGLWWLLSLLLGRHAFLATHWNQVAGQFSSQLASRIMITIDDATWGGFKKDTGYLKNLITGKTITVEGKGTPVINVKNYARVVIACNDNWAVPKDQDDRRFFVIDVVKEHGWLNKEGQLDEAGYQAFFETYKKPENLAKLLGFLLKYDLGDWWDKRISDIRSRKVGSDMSFNAMNLYARFLFEVAANRSIAYPIVPSPVGEKVTAADIKALGTHRWPAEILMRDLRKYYNNWCEAQGHRDDCNSINFSKSIRENFCINSGDEFKGRKDSKGLSLWSIPTLEEFRKQLIEKFNQPADYFDGF